MGLERWAGEETMKSFRFAVRVNVIGRNSTFPKDGKKKIHTS